MAYLQKILDEQSELKNEVISKLMPLYKGREPKQLTAHIKNNEIAYVALLSHLMEQKLTDAEIYDFLGKKRPITSPQNIFARIVLSFPNHLEIDVNEEPPFERSYKWSNDPLKIGGPMRKLYEEALANVGSMEKVEGKVTLPSLLCDEEFEGKVWNPNLHDVN